MILKLDAGNTLLKWQLLSGSCVVQQDGCLSAEKDEFEFLTQNALFQKVRKLLVSNVSGRWGIDSVCEWYKEAIGESNVFIAKSEKMLGGVSFAYKQIDKLGVDRCLVMVAAYQSYPGGVLVVDCGSAITADLVSSEGVHLGGYIVPGLQLIRSSLIKGTSDIVVKKEGQQMCSPGVTTDECVGNGINAMIVSTVRSFMKVAKELGINQFVLTGGDADYIMQLGLGDFMSSKDLLFQGLEFVSPYSFSRHMDGKGT